MDTVFNHIRDRLLVNVVAADQWPKADAVPVTIDTLEKEQWSDTFERLMRNRFMMGYFRYGSLKEQIVGGNSKKYHHLDSAKRRIALYEKTGNDELLVDVANMMMAEFLLGRHPDKHLSSVDDGEHMTSK
jgi:hypothetical protein